MGNSKSSKKHYQRRRVELIPDPFSGTGLVWIDMEPLLQKERYQYEKTLRDLEIAKGKLNRFRTVSEPAYSQWFYSHFGEDMTRIRELQARAEDLGDLVSTVQEQALESRISEQEAYRRIQQMQKNAEELKAKMREDSLHSESSESTFKNENPDISQEFEEFFKINFEPFLREFSSLDPDEFEELVEELKQDFIAGRSAKEDPFDRPSRPIVQPLQSEPDEFRRKQLYRNLARKLHPDVNAGLSQHEKELWYEVQAAYEAKSLGRLETLSALAEGGSEIGLLKIRSVSSLQAIVRDFQAKLRSAQKALREAKKQAAWNFHEILPDSKRLGELFSRIERDLSETAEYLVGNIAAFEKRIERWKSAPVQKSSKTTRGRSRSSRYRARHGLTAGKR